MDVKSTRMYVAVCLQWSAHSLRRYWIMVWLQWLLYGTISLKWGTWEKWEFRESSVLSLNVKSIYFIYVPSPLWCEVFGYGLRLDLSDVPSGHVISTNIWIVQTKCCSCLQTSLNEPTWKLHCKKILLCNLKNKLTGCLKIFWD